jgi:arginine decarboxylase
MMGSRRLADGWAAGKKITEVVTVAINEKPQAYNSLWQLRADAWSSLEESAAQLTLAGAQQRSVRQLAETVARLLNVLEPMERFWAFPGTRAFQEVRRLFTAGKYGRFAAVIARINRALVTDSYRGGQPEDLGGEDDAYDGDARPVEQGRPDRPYFEVLVVEDMSEAQERSLR